MTTSNRARRFALVLSCAQLLTVALACTVEDGDRAAAGGACPEGETCSPLAESGLVFAGPYLGARESSRLGPTASFGTQTIRMTGASSYEGVHVESSSYWHVTVSEVAEDGTFVVEALGEGDTPVEVRDAEGRLLDRVSLRSARIASVDVAGTDDAAPVLRAGATASLVVRLFDETGERLVDDTMTIEVEGATLTTVSWDCFDVAVPAGASQGSVVTVRVTTGDRRTHVIEVPLRG